MITDRWPVDLCVVALRSDQQHRAVDQRVVDAPQQGDHQGVGPLQVVDEQYDRPDPAAPPQRLDDQAEQGLAGLGRGHLVEARWEPTEVLHRLDHPAECRIVGGESEQPLAERPAGLAETLGRGQQLASEATEHRAGERRPDVLFPVGQALAGEDDAARCVEALEHVRDEAGLARPGLAGHGDDGALPLAHHRQHRLEQPLLLSATDEGDLVGTGAHGPSDPDHTPDDLGLLAAAQIHVVDPLDQDAGGQQLRRRVAHEDGPGRCRAL